MRSSPGTSPQHPGRTAWPVMVLAHNEERHITACLDSIFAADPGNEFQVFGRRPYEFQVLGTVLKTRGIYGLPADITELYDRADSRTVRWEGLYTIPNIIALRQMRSLPNRAKR